MAVERDSRTYKMAASIARLGYESIVVEGEPSRMLPNSPPFRLLSPPQAADEAVGEVARGGELANGAPEPGTSAPLLVRIGRRLPRPIARPLGRAWAAGHRLAIERLWWPVRNTAYVLGWNLRDLIRRNRETSSLLPDADVYWLHSFWQAPSVYMKARHCRSRFLYDTPDAYWEPGQSPAANRSQRVVTRSLEVLEARAIRRAACFTSVSEGVAGLLERRFGRRPLVIRNSHDPRLDEAPDADVRSTTGSSPKRFLLVMTGNLKPGMAVREALLALQRLPELVHLAFVGRGHDQSRQHVEELGLSDRVHLLPPVPPMQVVGFIRTADASPILYRAGTTNYLHALPNGFFHAVAAGLPLLFPPLPEIRSLAHQHDLGVEIDPEDPASIVSGVTRLIDDPEAVATYRANAERTRAVLNWEHEESILAEILGGEMRGRPDG